MGIFRCKNKFNFLIKNDAMFTLKMTCCFSVSHIGIETQWCSFFKVSNTNNAHLKFEEIKTLI